MNKKIVMVFLSLCVFSQAYCAAAKTKADVKKGAENKKIATPTITPLPPIAVQLPDAKSLREQLQANPFNPKHDYSHFVGVMELDTQLAHKRVTKADICRIVEMNINGFIKHTHLPEISAKPMRTKHQTKIIALLLEYFPQQSVPKVEPAKKPLKSTAASSPISWPHESELAEWDASEQHSPDSVEFDD